jgi:hypothetical protein
MRIVSCLAASAALVFLSAPASAQRDATTGEALFRAGRAAADRGDFSAACPKFEESNRLDPALGTVFNLADCDEHIGKIATAWQLFKEVAQRLPPGDDRIGISNGRAAALEPRLPKIVLKTKPTLPSGLTVLRDGVELGNATFDTPIPVDPGDHVIVVKAPGRADREFLVRANISQTSDVPLDVGPVAVSHPKSTGTTVGGDVGVRSTSSGGRNALGVSLLVLGGAGIATGLVTGAVALSAKNTVQNGCDPLKNCSDDAVEAGDRGKMAANISTVAFTVGLVGTAAGVFVLLMNKSDGKTAAPARAPVEATLIPGGAFVSVQGRVW